MIVKPSDLLEKLLTIRKNKGRRKGVSTGFCEMDENLYLSKQYLMVVTGMPSCGKSEFLDAIAVNTAILHDWNWLYFSPENYPLEEHLKKMVERKMGGSIQDAPEKEIAYTCEWAEKHFAWIHPEEEVYSVIDVLMETEARILEGEKVDVVVIDPWNELNHAGQAGLRDDQYISKCLTTIRQFHRKYNILTCIVIHPTKMQKDPKTGNYPVPSLYDCNGGAMWRNKADFGLCVHRYDMTVNEVSVFVQKVKYKTMGKIGEVKFQYEFASGRFKHPLDPCYNLPEKEKS